MSNKNLIIIEQICKNNNITDFLYKKGISPSAIYKDKYLYICPLPGHDEKKPSFVVYEDDNGQNFFCFGCRKSGNIIKLYSYINNVRWSVALADLGGNIDISDQKELEFIVNGLKKNYQKIKEDAYSIFERLSLEISSLGYDYLEMVEFDKKELEFLEKLYKKIDFLISSENIAELIEVYNFLVFGEEDRPPLSIKLQEWNLKNGRR